MTSRMWDEKSATSDDFWVTFVSDDQDNGDSEDIVSQLFTMKGDALNSDVKVI